VTSSCKYVILTEIHFAENIHPILYMLRFPSVYTNRIVMSHVLSCRGSSAKYSDCGESSSRAQIEKKDLYVLTLCFGCGEVYWTVYDPSSRTSSVIPFSLQHQSTKQPWGNPVEVDTFSCVYSIPEKVVWSHEFLQVIRIVRISLRHSVKTLQFIWLLS